MAKRWDRYTASDNYPVGTVIGWATVVSYPTRLKGDTHRAVPTVQCAQCNKRVKRTISNIKQTKSCGCGPNARNTVHGYYGTQTYKTWVYLKWESGQMSKEWDAFDAFLKSMGERPEGSKISRHDKNKLHGPGNSYWLQKKGNE